MAKPNPSSVLARMQRELSQLEADAQLRNLEINTGVNLCSNDYLGLSRDRRLKEAVIEGVSRTAQVGATGSRLLSGNSREWQGIEEEFAAFAGTSDALYFGSGYAANIGLLGSVLRPEDVVFSDALNHASIIDGIRLSGARKFIYPHRDLEALEKGLSGFAHEGGSRIIVTESVFSMDGDRAPIAELLSLGRSYGAELIVDEAHATGVHGPRGRGLVAEAGVVDEVLAVVHTCGKALASAGAFVCSGPTLKQLLINRARTFIFSTATPPYVAHQIRAALRISMEAGEERAYLDAMSAQLRSSLQACGFNTGTSTSQIVPVILGSNEMALGFAAELAKCRFFVRAIRPPTVSPGTARLRLSLTSALTGADMERLTAAIIDAREAVGATLHA